MIPATPSPEVSKKLVDAICSALQEEKVPQGKRVFKALLGSIICAIIMGVPLFLLFKEQMGAVWDIAMGVWWLCLFTGFCLHYHPQPRLVVPGYWSPWIFAKILIVMTALTIVEIIICPSFLFLESPLSLNPLIPLTHLFMSWGGMNACMFFCGLIFSAIGGGFTFLVISKTVKRSSFSNLFGAAAVAYFTQLPIVAVQAWDKALRPFVLFWVMGSLIGTVGMILIVRMLFHLFPYKKE